jgi:hypothetical protein
MTRPGRATSQVARRAPVLPSVARQLRCMPGEAGFWIAAAASGKGRIAERTIRTAAIGPISVVAEFGGGPRRLWLLLEAQYVIARCDDVCSSDSASARARRIAAAGQYGSFAESTAFGSAAYVTPRCFNGVLQLPPVCHGAESRIPVTYSTAIQDGSGCSWLASRTPFFDSKLSALGMSKKSSS